jgi:hypothetical protein
MLKRLRNIQSVVKNHLERNFKKLVMCKKCRSFYYKRRWHFETPGYVENGAEEEVFVHLTQCPACMEFEVTLSERDDELIQYGLLL